MLMGRNTLTNIEEIDRDEHGEIDESKDDKYPERDR